VGLRWAGAAARPPTRRGLAPPRRNQRVMTGTQTTVEEGRAARRRHAAALLFFVIATVVFTYPLAFRIAGSAPDRGDSPHLAWVMAWDAHALFTNPRHLFDPNSFYPHRGTLAYAEHMLGSALLGLPVWLLTREPMIVLNVLTLFSFVMLGWGTYLLAFHYFRNIPAAITAGFAAAFASFRFAHFIHLNWLTVQWVPFVFLYLDRYLLQRRRRDLLRFSVFYFLQMLTTMQAGAFLTLAVVLYLAAGAAGRRATWRAFLAPAAAMAVCLLAQTPVLLPYLRHAHEPGFLRGEQETAFFSARPIDFVTPTQAQTLYRWLHGLGVGGPLDRWDTEGFLYLVEHALFPGAALVVLAAVGAAAWRRGRAEWLTIVIAMWILSLGPRLGWLPMPYWILYHFAPGFSGMRAASRLFLFAVLGMAILAGAGVKWLSERRSQGALAALLGGLAVLAAESLCVPAPLVDLPLLRNAPRVYGRLAGMPGAFPIVELPMGLYLRGKWYPMAPYPEGPRLYFSALHWKLLVNGFSGHVPDEYPARVERMNRFPAAEVWKELRALGVRYVIVHVGQYPPWLREPIQAVALALPGAESYGGDVLVPVSAQEGG